MPLFIFPETGASCRLCAVIQGPRKVEVVQAVAMNETVELQANRTTLLYSSAAQFEDTCVLLKVQYAIFEL